MTSLTELRRLAEDIKQREKLGVTFDVSISNSDLLSLLDQIQSLEKEIERLKDFEWKYKGLCK